MIRRDYLFEWIWTAIMVVAASTAVQAQRDSLISREVEVVKSFNPAAMDAQKINTMPVIKDEEHKKPSFDYSISSQPVFSTFSVTNLQAATIVGKPKSDNGYGLLRLGVGNYNKPYGEFFFNNKSSTDFLFGIHFKHLSSHGKVKLENDEKVKAPFSDNEAEIYFKHMFRQSILSVDFNFNHNGYNYYGYPGLYPTPADSMNLDTYLGERQTLTKGGFNINLQSLSKNKDATIVGFDLKYHYLGTKTNQREHFTNFDLNFKKPMGMAAFLLNAGIDFSQATEIMTTDTIPEIGTRNQVWVYGKPAIYVGNETINLKLGGRLWFTFDNQYQDKVRIAPDIRFNFIPVKEIIGLYAGVDGRNHHNYYSAVLYHNPFFNPQLTVKNHFEKLRFYGGLDGRITSKTNFKLEVAHSSFTDHPLYFMNKLLIPDLIDPATEQEYTYYNNVFDVLYEDMQTLKFNVELTHNVGEKFNLLLSGNYYKYYMDLQEKPWNMPEFDATFTLSCQVTERLKLAADVFVVGQRDALAIINNADETFTNEIHPLGAVIDLNARGVFDITSKFSIFAQLNNFGFQKYERWLGYPVQSFNFLGGISISF
ncbi:MAG: hypothetical protein FWG22_00460 [Prolixibacteraceae bacterium]|nr:hypothetical protein [Prolixibacteraceae bacterium]